MSYGTGLYEDKHSAPVVTRPGSSVVFAIDSGDRFNPSLDPAQNLPTDGNSKAYNNFVINKNQNLLQGAFTRLGVSDVRFPYAIPNVNMRNNTMFYKADVGSWIAITIEEGFYDGSGLALAIQTEIGIAGLTCSYLADGRFSFEYSGVGPYVFQLSPIRDPLTASPVTYNSTRSLMDLIGMPPIQGMNYISNDLTTTPLTGGMANLKYTDYIDVVSYQLTNNQKTKDMTTQNFVPRSALVSRIFIENENSINSPTNVYGTFPFTIYRQYSNPKMIRWENDRSVGQIDIALYDMYGDPLYTPLLTPSQPLLSQPRPMPDFQITFLATED